MKLKSRNCLNSVKFDSAKQKKKKKRSRDTWKILNLCVYAKISVILKSRNRIYFFEKVFLQNQSLSFSSISQRRKFPQLSPKSISFSLSIEYFPRSLHFTKNTSICVKREYPSLLFIDSFFLESIISEIFFDITRIRRNDESKIDSAKG